MNQIQRGSRSRWPVFVLVGGLLAGAAGWAAAQDQPADLEQAVGLLERQQQGLEARAAAVTAKLRATDDQIETRIARLVETLNGVTDSDASRTKVIQVKEEAFAGLKRSLQMYVSERDVRLATLYQPLSQVRKAQLVEDVRVLHARIEKRVGQILSLLPTLPVDPTAARSTLHYDDHSVTQRSNPAYARQRLAINRAQQLREQIEKDLKASVAKLESSRLQLERARANARTPEGRQFIEEMIRQNTTLVAERRAQLTATITSGGAGARPLGDKAADALLEMMTAERAEARRDQQEWTRLKSERDLERERLAACQVRLASARRQLP